HGEHHRDAASTASTAHHRQRAAVRRWAASFRRHRRRKGVLAGTTEQEREMKSMKSSTHPRRSAGRLAAVAAAVALAIGLTGCGGGTAATGAGDDGSTELSIGYAFAPETLDPVYAIAGAQASAHIQAIYGALIERD